MHAILKVSGVFSHVFGNPSPLLSTVLLANTQQFSHKIKNHNNKNGYKLSFKLYYYNNNPIENLFIKNIFLRY
jgi:hypothetical protein